MEYLQPCGTNYLCTAYEHTSIIYNLHGRHWHMECSVESELTEFPRAISFSIISQSDFTNYRK